MLTYDINRENVTAKGSSYLTEDKIEQNHETSPERKHLLKHRPPRTCFGR